MASSLGSSPTFAWLDKEFSIRQLIKWIQKDFEYQPESETISDHCTRKTFKKGLVCVIVTGFEGGQSSQTISSEEVFFIQDILEQSRALFEDESGRYLSLPDNFSIDNMPARFNVSYDGEKFDSSPLTADQLMNLLKTPTSAASGFAAHRGNFIHSVKLENDILVLVNSGPKCSARLRQRLGKLNFLDIFSERYLLAYSLVNGKPFGEPSVIPAFWPITLDVADGFVGSQRTDFEEWLRCSSEAVCELRHPPVSLCSDIIEHDENPVDEYDYVLPVSIAAIQRKLLETQHFESPTASESSLYEQPTLKQFKNSDQTFSNQTSRQDSFELNRAPPLALRSKSTPSLCCQKLSTIDEKRRPIPPRPSLKVARAIGRPSKALPPVPPFTSIYYDPNENPTSAIKGLNSIDEYSKTDLAEVLMILKMSHHVPKFIDNDVDGTLLKFLDESILVEDLGMTKLEARKLKVFITEGWRPK